MEAYQILIMHGIIYANKNAEKYLKIAQKAYTVNFIKKVNNFRQK